MPTKRECRREGRRESHTRAREVIRHTGGIVRVKFPSSKNGRLIHCEGLLELDAAYLFETSHRIRAFREQPTTISYPDGASLRRYTPDFAVDLITGATVLVEIKPAARLANLELQQKFSCIRAYFERREVPFELLTDATIRSQPRLDAARAIHRNASRERISDAALDAAVRHHRHCFPMSLQRLRGLLTGSGITPYCLLRAGLLHFDPHAPLNELTELTSHEECPNEPLLSPNQLGF